MSEPRLSIAIPVFNEEASLPDLHESIVTEVDRLGVAAELIYADDGSTDGSLEVLHGLAAADERVVVVVLRRNYGQTAAMSAAFEAARGEIVVSMDADGQNDPADIGALLARLDEGFDVVSGWRQKRRDRWLTRKVPSIVANRIIGWITGLRLHDYGCSLKAYRRELLADVRLYGEMHRFIPVFAHWQGARVTEIPVRHHPRRQGVSKYGLERTVKVLVDLILLKFMGSYASRPGHFSGIGAAVSALLSVVIFLSVAGRVLFLGGAWISPAIIISFFLMGLAVQFMLFGLLAEMIMRTYYESQGRRPYLVREVRRGGGEVSPARS